MKEIQLTRGAFALVDDEDFERVNAHKWCAHVSSRGTKIYAVRSPKKHERERWKSTHIRLHNFVLDKTPSEIEAEFGPDYIIDHCNHNGLDCRKFIDNKPQLEIITQAENMERSKGWKRKGQPALAQEPFL